MSPHEEIRGTLFQQKHRELINEGALLKWVHGTGESKEKNNLIFLMSLL